MLAPGTDVRALAIPFLLFNTPSLPLLSPSTPSPLLLYLPERSLNPRLPEPMIVAPLPPRPHHKP
jgi:hypothetical protein